MKSLYRPLTVLVIALLVLAVLPVSAQKSDTEANKALVMRFAEELWGGNLDVADEILAEDFVARFPDGAEEDRETYLAETVVPNLAAIPDWSNEFNALLAEGDLVALVYNWGGTFENELFGMPPTGKALRLNGIDFVRVEDGKIAEFVVTFSTLSYMQQLGVAPAEGEVMPEELWDVTLGTTSSTPEEHKWVSSRALASVNENHIDWMDEIVTEDVVIHWYSLLWDVEGLPAWKETWANIKAGNPEHRVMPGYIVAEGDLLAVHGWVYSPSPGVSLATLQRFEDGKIAEEWDVWDTYAPMRAAAAEAEGG